ncbi:response regulator [Thermostilla marina]
MKDSPIVILYVEDNPDHAMLFRRAVERCCLGYRVQHAEDGEAALDYLFHRGKFADTVSFPDPDLVVLDLKLPRIDGLDVLDAIKTTHELEHLPVVVLTSSESPEDIDAAYARRAAGYLVKPMASMQWETMARSLTDYWRRSDRWNSEPRC